MFLNKVAILHAADKALGALNRIRAGTIAEERRMSIPKGQVKRSLKSLFKKDNKRSRHQIAWKHTFVCLAYKDQNRIPTTELEKDELYEAGLGTQDIEFSSINMNAEEFLEMLHECPAIWKPLFVLDATQLTAGIFF